MQDYRISMLRPTDDVIVIQVSGEVDLASSLAFKQHLFGELEREAALVILDLDAADRVDTTGLSVILELARHRSREDQELAIVCSKGRVRHALAVTGLDQMITVCATLEEALRRGDLAP